MNQSTKRITRIFKAFTSSIVFILMITISSTNNIIANSNHSIIVTIVNVWLILDLVIDFQFAFRRSVSYMINSTVDRQIIRKRKAMISKNALRIVISNKNRVKDLNIVWNNLWLNSKIIKIKIDKDFITQFFEELNIDFEISFDNTSINEFVIELDNEIKLFFIVVNSIDDSKTISAIIIMLADKTFKHRFISMNIITVSSNSISYIYNVFIASKYDDREFKNILIDHDAANFSSEVIEQFTILQRINKTTLILNKKTIIFFKFDIDETFFIDIVNLNIFVDVITFHIVLVKISFLLCLVDMNHLRFYYNNLINMFIEERLINKVLFRKEFYVIHLNQIKRFQIQILMNSKSLIQKSNTILDLQIDIKTSLINELQINLKIEHFRTIDNLHISMKKKHHSMIRWYDHAFSFLKYLCAVINNEIFRSKLLLFYRDRIASFSSTFRSFLDSTFANDSWSI
jgi:hypothetical protein